LDCIKKEFETSQDWKKMQKEEGPGYVGVGFKYSDLEAFYGDCTYKDGKIVDINNQELKDSMNTIYDNLSTEQFSILKSYKISVWELITRNSGGHPSITNIQGWGFLKYNKDATMVAYETDKYTDVMKRVAREFVDNLKDKVESFEQGKAVQYDTKGIEFKGQDTNENFKNKSTNINKSSRIILKFDGFKNR